MLWEPTPGMYPRHLAPKFPPVLLPDGRELGSTLRAVLPFAAPRPSTEARAIHLETIGDFLRVTAHDGSAFRRECIALPEAHRGLDGFTIPADSAYDLARELGGRHRRGFPAELHLVETFTTAPEPRGLELLVRCDGRVLFACEATEAPGYTDRLVTLMAGVYDHGIVQ